MRQGLRVRDTFICMSDVDKTARAILASFDRRIAAAEARLIDLPHVVHVYDRELGFATVVGPFRDALSAAKFADRFIADVEAGEADGTLRADVLPLEAPEDLSGHHGGG